MTWACLSHPSSHSTPPPGRKCCARCASLHDTRACLLLLLCCPFRVQDVALGASVNQSERKRPSRYAGTMVLALFCASLTSLAMLLGDLVLGNPSYLSNWMKDLDDDTPLENINIPGTHDAAACTSQYYVLPHHPQLKLVQGTIMA